MIAPFSNQGSPLESRKLQTPLILRDSPETGAEDPPPNKLLTNQLRRLSAEQFRRRARDLNPATPNQPDGQVDLSPPATWAGTGRIAVDGDPGLSVNASRGRNTSDNPGDFEIAAAT
jgi:hypothetical protein